MDVKENRPGANRAARTSYTTKKFIAYRRRDGYAAPTLEDRREAAVLAEATELGYRLATRCTRCHKWVVAHDSVAAHMGPVCRAKVAAK
jgi:hypothetical protein